MPIVSTVTISKEILSLKFNRDDTLEVILIAAEDGGQLTQETHMFSPTVVGELLDVQPPLGYTMRQAIVSSIYTKLLDSGKVVGNIVA